MVTKDDDAPDVDPNLDDDVEEEGRGTGLGNADARAHAWTQEGDPLDYDIGPDDVLREAASEPRVRARSLGLHLGFYPPGPNNAITDVKGVRVGHQSVVHGEGKLQVGQGPARTGATAILPTAGNVFMDRLLAGGFVLNGAGEMTGLTQVLEWGLLESPIVLTNTLAVGAAHDAMVQWMVKQNPGIGREHDTVLPVVGECDDSWLNDIGGLHVKREHVFAALDGATDGPVAEGTVGSGTGMVTADFAGGIGTSSRRLLEKEGGFTVGVLVQSNFGRMVDLRMGGVPVGAHLFPRYKQLLRRGGVYGSIIVVVATDAPLSTHQLNRLARRAALGIGRSGSYAGHGSGEIILAFSTHNRLPRTAAARVLKLDVLSDEHLDPLFRACIEATDESILNALCMARPMVGANGHIAPALPLAQVREVLARWRSGPQTV